jgi:AbrB family looped-hinge helix DNA binding protein
MMHLIFLGLSLIGSEKTHVFAKQMSMEVLMKSVTVSPRYQITIPREVRESMEIKPGSKVQVLLYENRIELIPMKNLRRMRGFLKGMDTTVERERDRV